MVHAAVPPLHVEAPLELLGISSARLRLHADADSGQSDHGVPRSPVTRVGQGHLPPPLGPLAEVSTQLLQQSSMGLISERMA